MYEEHFRLQDKPFSMLPDPSFIYWGERYALAYAMLEYGVISNSGITVITGEIGCGKTTLIRHLLSQLNDEITVGLLSNTHLASNELMRWVLMAFDQPFEQKTTVAAFRDFQQFVIDQYSRGKRSLLIVDEAQNLSITALEELRMLSNINSHKECLLQIVLTGQPQLRDILRKPELEQLAQRVGSDFHVEPLQVNEVQRYIHHRLIRAGCDIKLFSRKACDIAAEASHGVPRTINLLCDTALVYAFARGQRHVTSHIMEAVVADKKKFGIFHHNDEDSNSAKETVALADRRIAQSLAPQQQSTVKGKGLNLRLAGDKTRSD